MGFSLIQGSPTDCSISECDREPHGEGLSPLVLSNHEKGEKNWAKSVNETSGVLVSEAA